MAILDAWVLFLLIIIIIFYLEQNVVAVTLDKNKTKKNKHNLRILYD